MNIGIIDAEIIGKKKHRFPNLACMKISSYHKHQGDRVSLLLDYNTVDDYDTVYICKVFTNTEVPKEPLDKSKKNAENIIEWYADNEFLKKPNVVYGGTGFYFKNAPPLPNEIEHARPDYHLYDDWVNACIVSGVKRNEFAYYLDYSIGYLTRKCFRQCQFCVNERYTHAETASPLYEFLDENRPKICLLDDNFFAHQNWKELIKPVIDCGKRFQFKQGLDERLLSVEKIQAISRWKYDGEVIFAFDNIEDSNIIISKLKLIRETVPEWTRELKFYVFCGYDRNDVWDEEFWENDIRSVFERITILRQFHAKPYIMRHERVYGSEYSSFYAVLAAYINQPVMFNSFSFRTFAQCRGMRREGYKKYKRDISGYLKEYGYKGSEWRNMEWIEAKFPEIASAYYDLM